MKSTSLLICPCTILLFWMFDLISGTTLSDNARQTETNLGNIGTTGREFVFNFPTSHSPRYSPIVMISTLSTNPVKINVSIPGIGFYAEVFTTRFNNTEVKLPKTYSYLDTVGYVQNRTVIVRAEGGDVTVYGMTTEGLTADGFVAIPTKGLGRRYVIATYGPSCGYYYKTEFSISSLGEPTEVQIQRHVGVPIDISLPAYQSYQIFDGYMDLTGAIVEADKPIAVMAGSELTGVPTGNGCDLLLEQLPSTESYGRNFVLAPFKSLLDGYVYRILTMNKTIITITNSGSITFVVDQMYEGAVSDDSVTLIKSDQPILVMQYLRGDRNGRGDGAMVYVPPTEMFTGDVSFSVYNASGRFEDFQYYINVICQCSVSRGMVYEDNTPVADWEMLNNNDTCVFRSEVTPGSHRVWHAESDATFMVIVYGIRATTAFAYPAGYNLLSNPVVTETLSSNITVNNPDPVEGSLVSFTCLFSLGTGEYVTSVIWSFGPALAGSARIVDWTYDDPNVVHYNHGYSSPIYQMSIASMDKGNTVLTVNPVERHDEGRYWCNVFTNVGETSAFADIWVSAKTAPDLNLYLEGESEFRSGSMVSFLCNYTKSIHDIITKVGWFYGNQFESSTQIADLFIFENQGEPHISYNEQFTPPSYEVIFGEIGNGLGGYSTLTIASAEMTDSRRYWCMIQISRDARAPMDFVDLEVLGQPTTETATTTTPSTTTVATMTTRTTTKTMTTTTRPTTRPTTTPPSTMPQPATTTRTSTTMPRATTGTSMMTSNATTTDERVNLITTANTIPSTLGTRTANGHFKLMVGVALAGVPAAVILLLAACVVACRSKSRPPTPISHEYDKPIPKTGYQDLRQHHRRLPRAYQRLVTSIGFVMGRSRPSDEPEYEYAEPHHENVQMYQNIAPSGNLYHEYSPVSPGH